MLRATTRLTLRTSSAPLRICMQKRFYDEKPTPHSVEKDHDLDAQTAASKRGMEERQQSRSSNESQVKKKDPKKEHPEAPGPIIGMQGERGHRGA